MDPERGRPRSRGEELRCEQRLRATQLLGVPLGVVADARAPQTIAFLVVLERFRELPGVFERLAEREMKVKAILWRQLGSRQLRLHRLDVCGLELEGLQVG